MRSKTKTIEIELGIKEPSYQAKLRKAREILGRGYSVRIQTHLRGKEKENQRMEALNKIHSFMKDLDLDGYSVKSVYNGDEVVSVVLKG
jgi:translation initiation factor IF-3